jgi:hypothetical protein
LQSGGGTLRQKLPPLGSLEYKPSRLGVQAKRLEAQTTTLEMAWAASKIEYN